MAKQAITPRAKRTYVGGGGAEGCGGVLLDDAAAAVDIFWTAKIERGLLWFQDVGECR